ncbi:MAG: hypothetical protein K2H61_09870 [Muribaculaceae bacterium]|nr:hypothetical protein [Muribaculaceae bacterium]MDE7393001.1 hypothetical protein [Muribaculaceae bacterium]
MKRFLILFLLLPLLAFAQDGLSVASLFDGPFSGNPKATETVMTGDRLKSYKLSSFHSLTLRDCPEQAATIESLVAHDGASAIDREVAYRDGGIYYAFYQLPSRGGLKRYLFYLNQHRNKGDRIVLIYIDGKADAKEIKKLLK